MKEKQITPDAGCTISFSCLVVYPKDQFLLDIIVGIFPVSSELHHGLMSLVSYSFTVLCMYQGMLCKSLSHSQGFRKLAKLCTLSAGVV